MDLDLEELGDWFLVEEEVFLEDELAESQIPEPGYAGTAHELLEETFEYDNYDYWDDVEYGNDEYWDGNVAKTASGQKRKRHAPMTRTGDDKRQKKTLMETSGGHVRFLSLKLRMQRSVERAPLLGRRNSFALLPDWRERFANDSGLAVKKPMPVEMKNAAEGVHFHADVLLDEEKGDPTSEQAQLDLPDPETLKAILRQKLGEAGLEGMDEAAFMQTIAKMLSGEGEVDSAADDLASSLLGQANEGNDQALSFLSQQGVSLDATEDDETSSVVTPELPEPTGEKEPEPNGHVSVPQIEIKKSKSKSSGLAQRPAQSSPTAHAKKRTASDDEQGSATKKKKVGLETQHESNGAEPQSPTIEDSPTSGPIDHDKTVLTTRARVANVATIKPNSKVENGADPKSLAGTDVRDEEPTLGSSPATATRKRKAQGEEDAAPSQKKQARKASATPNGPAQAAGRRTRAAVKAGK